MPEAEGKPIEVEARVDEALPNALYRVTLQRGTRQRITAHVSGSSSLLRLLPGDAVVVELMPWDPSRGRILRRRT